MLTGTVTAKNRSKQMLRSQTERYWEIEMAEYILLMHDAISNDDDWGPYVQKLSRADSSKVAAP